MTETPILLPLVFGKDQKTVVVHLLEEMKLYNIPVTYTIRDVEEDGCMFDITFPNARAIYVFGHRQGSMTANYAKTSRILFRGLQPIDTRLVSNCCEAPMIEPDWEAAEETGSLWRAYVEYICKVCGQVCKPVTKNI